MSRSWTKRYAARGGIREEGAGLLRGKCNPVHLEALKRAYERFTEIGGRAEA